MDPPEALHPPAPAPPPTRAHPRRSPCIPRRGPPFRGGPTMPAVVQVNEYNGAGSTKTPNVPRGDWLSADLPGGVARRNTKPPPKPPAAGRGTGTGRPGRGRPKPPTRPRGGGAPAPPPGGRPPAKPHPPAKPPP